MSSFPSHLRLLGRGHRESTSMLRTLAGGATPAGAGPATIAGWAPSTITPPGTLCALGGPFPGGPGGVNLQKRAGAGGGGRAVDCVCSRKNLCHPSGVARGGPTRKLGGAGGVGVFRVGRKTT